MGYMDISIGGSDMAADCHAGAVSALVESYKRDLKNPGNCYNTSGPINVGLSVASIGPSFWDYYYMDGDSFFPDLMKGLDDQIQQIINYKKAEPDRAGDEDENLNWHLKEYRAIRRKVKRIFDKVVANDI